MTTPSAVQCHSIPPLQCDCVQHPVGRPPPSPLKTGQQAQGKKTYVLSSGQLPHRAKLWLSQPWGRVSFLLYLLPLTLLPKERKVCMILWACFCASICSEEENCFFIYLYYIYWGVTTRKGFFSKLPTVQFACYLPCLSDLLYKQRTCFLTLNILVSVMNISNSPNPSSVDWMENGWILVWKSNC